MPRVDLGDMRVISDMVYLEDNCIVSDSSRVPFEEYVRGLPEPPKTEEQPSKPKKAPGPRPTWLEEILQKHPWMEACDEEVSTTGGASGSAACEKGGSPVDDHSDDGGMLSSKRHGIKRTQLAPRSNRIVLSRLWTSESGCWGGA